MRRYRLRLIIAAATLLAVGVVGCNVGDDPLSSQEESRYTVTIRVEPPEVLRTADTRDLWTEPVEAVFELDESFAAGTKSGSHSQWETVDPVSLGKPGHEDDGSFFIGARNHGGLNIGMHYGAGRAMWGIDRHGMMDRHGPGDGAHHYMVELFGDSTVSQYQGAMRVPHSSVSLTAFNANDTVEIELQPVHGAHGYRYESNVTLPEGEYDLQLTVAPPDFFRTEETRAFWTEPFTVEFTGFRPNDEAAGESVGVRTVADSEGHELQLALEGGPPREYWAMHTGSLSPTDEENVNLSLSITDPSREINEMPIYYAGVHMTVRDSETGDVVSDTLSPTFGPHGFYYGGNLMMEILSDEFHDEDGHHHGHGDSGGMGPGGGHMGG